MSSTGNQLEKLLASRDSVYLPDQSSIGKSGAYGWSLVPQSSASLLIQALCSLPADLEQGDSSSGGQDTTSRTEMLPADISKGFMFLWSDRPRALSQRERLWAAALAAKLQSVLI